jgi:glutaredoxin 3
MINIRMYCTAFCPYCVRAEMLLKSKGVKTINKILIDSIPDGFQDLLHLTGRKTVPQVFIGDRHIGGFDDLAELDSLGGLEPLLVTG